MNRIVIALALLNLSIGTAAPAQDAAPPAEEESKPAAAEKTPAEDEDAAESKASAPAADSQDAKSKPKKDSAGTPQRFIPSEQVRSDFDVSFPVDI